MTLEAFFREVPRAAVAFSGGTDSAFLLWAAKKYGCQIQAYYIHTAFQPEFELEDARRLAGELDIPMQVIDMDILGVQQAAENGPRRCYYCKRALFTRLKEQAADLYDKLESMDIHISEEQVRGFFGKLADWLGNFWDAISGLFQQ